MTFEDREERVQHFQTVSHQSFISINVRRRIGDRDVRLDDHIYETQLDDDQPNEPMEMTDLLSSGVQALHDQHERMLHEGLILQQDADKAEEHLSSLQISIPEQGMNVDAQKLNQDVLQQAAVSLKQVADDLQDVSYDGTMIWKIVGFREKLGMLHHQKERDQH